MKLLGKVIVPEKKFKLMKKSKIFALIPARGGSKGIKKKNLRKVAGKSLLEWSIIIAKKSNLFDKIVLSSDDPEIIDEGKRLGADVPFRRPPELSGDHSLTHDVWKHAWKSSEKLFSCLFEYSVLLEPTSPLRVVSDIEQTLSLVKDKGYSSALTLSKTPAHYTPHKTLKIKDNKIVFFHLDGVNNTNRQTIPDFYHRNGLCYAVNKDQIFSKNVIVDNNSGAVVIERNVVNIDDEFELKMAEIILNQNL